MKQVGYFFLACAAIVLVGWIVSKITGSRAYFIEDWNFDDGETVLWRDDETDTYLIPKAGTGCRHVVCATAPWIGDRHQSANPDRLSPALGKEAHGSVVLPPAKAPGSGRIDGGLFTVGYQTLVYDPAALDVHATDAKQYVEPTMLGSEASSTNLQTVRIFTDFAGTFRLRE